MLLPIILKKPSSPSVHHIIVRLNTSLASGTTTYQDCLERRHEYWDHIDGIGAIVRPPSTTVEAISIWSKIRQKSAKFWIETLIASKVRLR